MIRSTSFAVCLGVALAGLVACDKAADQQHEADEARAEASEDIVEASREATEKINAARAEADKKVAAAQADFLKLREDYRHSASEELLKVDKELTRLEAEAKTAKAQAKAKIEARLPEVRSLREAFMSEYRSLELSSAITWDEAKKRSQEALDKLKTAVDDAD